MAVAAALGWSWVAAQTVRRRPPVSSWTGIQRTPRGTAWAAMPGYQGDPETGGDEPESGGPVAGGEGDPGLGDTGPGAELRGITGTGPDDPALVGELAGFDPLEPNGARVVWDLMSLFRFDDRGRLVEEFVRTDNRSFLRQLGAEGA